MDMPYDVLRRAMETRFRTGDPNEMTPALPQPEAPKPNFLRAIGIAAGLPDLGAKISGRAPDNAPAPAPAPAPQASAPAPAPTPVAAALPRFPVSDQALRAANELTIRGGNSTKPFTREDLEAENPNATVRVHYPGNRPTYAQMNMMAPYLAATRPQAVRPPTGQDMMTRAYMQVVMDAAKGIPDPQKSREFIMDRFSSFMGKNPMIDMLRMQMQPEE